MINYVNSTVARLSIANYCCCRGLYLLSESYDLSRFDDPLLLVIYDAVLHNYGFAIAFSNHFSTEIRLFLPKS